jgi:lysophospholipase L1-like esterase
MLTMITDILAGWKRRFRIVSVVAGVLILLAAEATSAAFVSLGNILPLGDSITLGTVPGGYRARLSQKLTAASYDYLFVGNYTENPNAALTAAGQTHHEGHSSMRLDQIEANLDGNTNFPTGNGGYWLSGTTGRPPVYPNIVLLMAGINDIATGASAVVTRDRLDSLLEHIYTDRPTTTVIVSSLTPLTGIPARDWGERAAAYNALIPSVVAKHVALNRKAFFVDMNAMLTTADVSSDGVHLAQSGYDKMGDAWFGAIQAIPEPSAVTLLTTGTIGIGVCVACRHRHAFPFFHFRNWMRS